MTDAVHDYKSINRKLNRQEQKADFEAKNPKVEQSTYGTGWPFTIASPYGPQVTDEQIERLVEQARQANGLVGAPLTEEAHETGQAQAGLLNKSNNLVCMQHAI